MALKPGCDPIFDGRGVARDAQGRPVRTSPAAASAPRLTDIDFETSPFVVVWETTQACDLACRHCRAETQPRRHPDELSTLEAMRLMNDVRQFGRPLFVLSGGDPLKRPDIVALVKHGARLGLRVALAAGTTLVTPDLLAELRDVGLARLSVSLDGSTAEVHDGLRVPGSWSWANRTLAAARELGLPTQVDTTVSRRNLDDFDRLAAAVARMDIALWSVFFLVPLGRAALEDVLRPEEFESVFQRMYDLSLTAPFVIKSTAAPQYRRVVLQRQVAARRMGGGGALPAALTAGSDFALPDGAHAAKGVGDGNGFLFVGHTGEIYPSGFLPISAGNVRTDDIVEVYRTAPLFRQLRDRACLKGKCSVCEYRDLCGGNRSRAFAVTGDPLEADPFCAHLPVRYQRMVEAGEAQPVDDYFRDRVRVERALPAV
ncbi:MAG: TIGR04053 family radical SAM/SPASM domain-containing protein [Gemmatimonadota bacterium]|jgi:radical SAM protein